LINKAGIQIQTQIKQRSNQQNIPKVYKDIAEGMEGQFAKMMIDQMNKTVMKEKKSSSAEDYYNSMLDYERASAMTKGEGLGLQKEILKQIYPQNQNRRGLPVNLNSPKGTKL
jgi:Rod binding domain-containing protein